MSSAQQIAELIEEQAADEVAPQMNGHGREDQAGRLESDEAPDVFDFMVDPSADVLGEAIASEELDAYGASEGPPRRRARPECQPAEAVGMNVIGWARETEAAALLGRACPACRDDPGPGRICLACCRAGNRLKLFLAHIKAVAPDHGVEAAETGREARAARDLEPSLAGRRWTRNSAAWRQCGLKAWAIKQAPAEGRRGSRRGRFGMNPSRDGNSTSDNGIYVHPRTFPWRAS